MKIWRLAALVGAGLTMTAAAQAQTIGPLRWQLAPYCNVVTLTITAHGATYALEGTDDQCGQTPARAGVIGLAFPMPNGSIGMSLTAVSSPSATPIHTDVTLNVSTLQGTWRDSAGNSGAFTFTPGASAPGAVRPLPPIGLGAGSVTTAHLAAGAVVADILAAGAVSSGKIAPSAIDSSTLIAPGTIELSDLNQLGTVGIGSPWTIPAGGCVSRETTSVNVADVQEGDLLLTRIQNGPAGVFTQPAMAGANGRFAYTVCNATTASITSFIAISLKRVPR